jgi:hypothetical protein
VDATPIEGWAYADNDQARQSPETVEWGYVEKTAYRCRNCRHEWTTAGSYHPYREKDGTQVRFFRDDDASYTAWLRAWPQGYVLNCERHPGPSYLMLHRATCTSIAEPQMTTFTGQYIKVCSTDRQAVREWAKENTGGLTTACQLCM